MRSMVRLHDLGVPSAGGLDDVLVAEPREEGADADAAEEAGRGVGDPFVRYEHGEHQERSSPAMKTITNPRIPARMYLTSVRVMVGGYYGSGWEPRFCRFRAWDALKRSGVRRVHQPFYPPIM